MKISCNNPAFIREELEAFAKLLIVPGACVELRTLPPTHIGYFTDVEKFADATCSLSGKVNCYATLNPVKIDLLSRAENKLVQGQQNNSTKDEDVACRRWFLIDIDDKSRAKNTNATNDELMASKALCQQVVTDLKTRGVECLVLCSGNGWHILIGLPEYPNDERHKEKHKLLLAWFTRTYCEGSFGVDPVVYNASRISRIPGTFNLKGPDTPGRPQRIARIKLPVVAPKPVDLFAIFAGEIAEQRAFETPRPSESFGKRESFSRFKGNLATLDIAALFQNAGLYRRLIGQGKHAVTCLWDNQHTTGSKTDSSTIIWEGDGSKWANFYCSHSHCHGKGLRDVLDHFGAQEVDRYCRMEFKIPPSASSGNVSEIPQHGISYRKASDIESRPIRWLWNGRIARGKVTIVAGHPGLGKSQVTASMAAVVSSGGYWPADRTKSDRGSVVILSAEDDAADTIKPRLEAAGADLDRISIVDPAPVIILGDYDRKTRRAFTLDNDLPRLEESLSELRDVSLVIIDPITAFLGKADGHKNAEIRALLAPLSELAAKHEVAVVCVSHFSKGGNSESKLRVMGSLAFVAAARAAYAVLDDPDNKDRRLFLPIKNNIGNDQTGFAFTVQGVSLKNPCGNLETSRVVWENDLVTKTANEVLATTTESGDATSEAIEWLRSLLADGPLKVAEINKEARQAGIGDKVLRTARERICKKPYKQSFASGWWWELKGHEDAQGATYKNRAASGIEGSFNTQEASAPFPSSGNRNGLLRQEREPGDNSDVNLRDVMEVFPGAEEVRR